VGGEPGSSFVGSAGDSVEDISKSAVTVEGRAIISDWASPSELRGGWHI
jgi:hypothetical protein